MKMKDLIQIIC